MLPTVFLDVDSTLIVPKQSISIQNTEAIRRYVQHGGRVHLVTGKLTSALFDLVKSLNIDHLIHGGANGGMILEHSREQCIHTIGAMSRDVASQLKELDVPYYLYYQDYIGYAHASPNEDDLDKIIKLKDPTPLYEDIHHFDDVIKVLTFLDKNNPIEPLIRERFKDYTDITIMRTSDDLLEFHHPMMKKSFAVNYILNKDHSPFTIAIGDSDNDRTMLEVVNQAFVVDNATEELKQMYPILPSCKDDGVAYLLNQLVDGKSAEVIVSELRKSRI